MLSEYISNLERIRIVGEYFVKRDEFKDVLGSWKSAGSEWNLSLNDIYSLHKTCRLGKKWKINAALQPCENFNTAKMGRKTISRKWSIFNNITDLFSHSIQRRFEQDYTSIMKWLRGLQKRLLLQENRISIHAFG